MACANRPTVARSARHLGDALHNEIDRIDTPRNFLDGIFLISGRSVSPVTIAPGVVRLVVAVLVPYCLPQGRVPRRLVPDQCDQRALPPPTRTSLTTAEPGLPSLSGDGSDGSAT